MQTVVSYLVLGSFLLFGSCFLLFAMLPAWQALLTKNWPATVGKVLRSGVGTEVREPPSGRRQTWVLHRAEVVYEYQVGGEKYSASTVYVGNASVGPRQAQRIANRYPPGADVLVHFNPADPKTAVLIPGVPPRLWIMAVSGAPFFVVGLGGILSMLRGMPLHIGQAHLFLVMGSVTMLFGVALIWIALRNLWLGSASAHWPTTPGTIITSFVRHTVSGKSEYRDPEIVYQYTVNGTQYAHSALDLSLNSAHGEDEAAEFVARYPVGATVTVSYDPAHPERAVLNPGRHLANLFLVAIGLALVAAGCVFLVLWFFPPKFNTPRGAARFLPFPAGQEPMSQRPDQESNPEHLVRSEG